MSATISLSFGKSMLAKLPITSPPDPANNFWVGGNSIMAGIEEAFYCTVAGRITARLATLKGWVEYVNAAIPGNTINDILNNISVGGDTWITTYRPGIDRYAIYGEVINSCGYAICTASQYGVKVTDLINHMHTVKGWPLSRIVIINGFWCTPGNFAGYGAGATYSDYLAFVAASELAAAAAGVVSISPLAFTEALGVAALDVYERHPIDAVTASIAAYIGGFLP